ncbi:hypothetical protein LRR81_08240 [Metabacillus sp. GX 13764]|uniref:hypothetical protein n=1 Tax=Metabacillus kandeliae TaxID=2900151 RepID=UPI001E451D97|nr:hypothetical protein [Metabacillus kandeliae]MCD7034221.1 hypothetical protein [Metabacillus kandeliae]
MIKILLEADDSLRKIHSGEVHWSKILELSATIHFLYRGQSIEFYTKHHQLTLADLADRMKNLILAGEPSIHEGYGAGNSLIMKKHNSEICLIKIAREQKEAIKVPLKETAADYIEAYKSHTAFLRQFQKDEVGEDHLEELCSYINDLICAMSKVS